MSTARLVTRGDYTLIVGFRWTWMRHTDGAVGIEDEDGVVTWSLDGAVVEVGNTTDEMFDVVEAM